MKFLADESCDFSVVRELRNGGYDVKSIQEISPRADDVLVINMALQEKRILITEDKDFGQLVFASGEGSSGVIFIRFPGNARTTLTTTVLNFVKSMDKKLETCFIVIQPGRIRISNIPE